MEQKLFIVNENGDILQEVGTDYERLANNTIIIKPKVQYRETKKIDYQYVKVNINLPMDFYKEYPQCLLFFPFIEYKTNFLIYPNGRYVNQTGFAKYTGYSRVYVSKIFNKFKKAKIIAPVKMGRKTIYMFNPYIALLGSYIYDDLLDNFKDNPWEKYGKRKGRNYEL